MTPNFAENIRTEAERDSLDVRIILRDVVATADDLRSDYRLIVLSEVVSDVRTAPQLRDMFELASQRLAPGGRLVFNVFLARHGYLPDDAARELGQQTCTIGAAPRGRARAARRVRLANVHRRSAGVHRKRGGQTKVARSLRDWVRCRTPRRRAMR